MTSDILIVGKRSFIATNFKKIIPNSHLISFNEIDDYDLSQYKTIINCSISQNYKNYRYDEKTDIDLAVARKAHKKNCDYIMISTRKVYGDWEEYKVFNEESPLNPFDWYSENKLITEYRILNLTPNAKIIRGSNIFGDELGRNSFMGFCMNQLKMKNEIIFNSDSSSKRDFIFVEDFNAILKMICDSDIKGIYNLGSGYGLEIGDFAKYLIQGYESGIFKEYINEKKQQFCLDVSKIEKSLGVKIGPFDFESIIKRLGANLK